MSNDFPLDLFLKNNDQKSNNLNNLTPSLKNDAVVSKESNFENEELNTIGSEILKVIKSKVSSQKYSTYFGHNLNLNNISLDKIEFVATTPFIKTIIESQYVEIIEESVKEILGKKYEISIDLDTSTAKGGNARVSEKSESRAKSAKEASFTLDLEPSEDDLISSIESKYIEHVGAEGGGIVIDTTKTFRNFIIGPSNNMAYATALAVAKNPGKTGKYPSLYIYSNSGLGKTHLLHAVANGIAELHPDLRICLITARDFMNELINMIKNNQINEFRRKYSEKVDVLMIDDIHELKSKHSTQNEFFHIFNELHNKGKQLIFTSDKSPKEIIGIEDRIKTRLQWGLVIDIQRPDLETRIAILKKKTQELDLFLPDSIINLMANSIKTSIRELEGSLIKLSAFVEVMNVEVDEDTVKELLLLEDSHDKSNLSIELIAKTTANFYKVSLADLKSKSRNKDITKVRHVAMYLSRKLLEATQQEIGMFFGGRDHTSVIHGVNKISKGVKEDPVLSKEVLSIENEL